VSPDSPASRTKKKQKHQLLLIVMIELVRHYYNRSYLQER